MHSLLRSLQQNSIKLPLSSFIIWLLGFIVMVLLCLFSNTVHAYGRCFDITGCCPQDYGSKTISCSIFGCHTCDINGNREDIACGGCQKADCADCRPVTLSPCCKPRPAKHRVKRRVRVTRTRTIVRDTLPTCVEPVKKIRICDKLPEEIIKCKVIFPGDLEENLCREFKAKLITCEPNTCFAPYSQDPSFRTTWEIHGRNANRCVVSSTYEDIGLRDRKDRPVPITLTCEYDKVGVRALIKRFNDIDKRYYHFTTCERGMGIHNCSITSNGKPLKKIKFQ